MRKKRRGKSASSNTYGDGAPSRFGGGRRLREERIEVTHTQTILPSFGPHRCIKPYCCLSDCIGFFLENARCYSKLGSGRGWMSSGSLPPSTCTWPPFICTRGHPQVAAQIR